MMQTKTQLADKIEWLRSLARNLTADSPTYFVADIVGQLRYLEKLQGKGNPCS